MRWFLSVLMCLLLPVTAPPVKKKTQVFLRLNTANCLIHAITNFRNMKQRAVTPILTKKTTFGRFMSMKKGFSKFQRIHRTAWYTAAVIVVTVTWPSYQREMFTPAAGYRGAKLEMYWMTVLRISGFARWKHIVIIQNLRNVPSVSCLHSAVAVPQ